MINSLRVPVNIIILCVTLQSPFFVLHVNFNLLLHNILHLKTLDTLCSDLHRQGIASTKNSAKVIELDDEDRFWQKGLLGFSTPKLLQCTVFLYVGLNFVLRGVQEQYDLIPSQFSHVPQDKSVYNTSKCVQYFSVI